jgi:hypothetical protein
MTKIMSLNLNISNNAKFLVKDIVRSYKEL